MNIFFDLDGPILNVIDRHHGVYVDIVRQLGGIPLPRETYWEAKRQREPETLILRRSALPESVDATFHRMKLERIESKAALRLDRIQSGVAELLERLKRSHQLFVVTLRNSRPSLETQLDELGLCSFFDLVLSGRDGWRDGWRIKCDLIRGSSTQLAATDWIIGDTETDILAGQSLGLRTAAVCNGIRTEALLRKLKPDRIMSSAANFVETLLPDESSIR